MLSAHVPHAVIIRPIPIQKQGKKNLGNDRLLRSQLVISFTFASDRYQSARGVYKIKVELICGVARVNQSHGHEHTQTDATTSPRMYNKPSGSFFKQTYSHTRESKSKITPRECSPTHNAWQAGRQISQNTQRTPGQACWLA